MSCLVLGAACQASLLSSYLRLTFSLLIELQICSTTAQFAENKDHGPAELLVPISVTGPQWTFNQYLVN